MATRPSWFGLLEEEAPYAPQTGGLLGVGLTPEEELIEQLRLEEEERLRLQAEAEMLALEEAEAAAAVATEPEPEPVPAEETVEEEPKAKRSLPSILIEDMAESGAKVIIEDMEEPTAAQMAERDSRKEVEAPLTVEDIDAVTPLRRHYETIVAGFLANNPKASAKEVMEFATNLSDKQFGGQFKGFTQDSVEEVLAFVAKNPGSERYISFTNDVLTEEQRAERDAAIDAATNEKGEVDLDKLQRPLTGQPGAAMVEQLRGGLAQTTGGLMQAVGSDLSVVFDKVGEDLRLRGQELAASGRNMVEMGDPGYEPGTPEYYAYNIAKSAVDMVPLVAGGAIAGTTKATAMIMAPKVFGQAYDQSITEGRTHEQAMMDGTFRTLFEVVPEKMALDVILGPASGVATGAVKGAIAETAQELLTEAANIGYDMGVLSKDVPAKEVLQRLMDAGIIGGGTGGVLGGGVQATRSAAESQWVEAVAERWAQRMATKELEGAEFKQDPTAVAAQRFVPAQPIVIEDIPAAKRTAEIEPPSQKPTVPKTLVGALVKRGINEDVAKGIAAGIIAESRNDHKALNPTSGAMGLGQWLGPRKAELIRRYGPNPTREQQIDFLVWELKGGDFGGKAVMASKNEVEALNTYITKFMRPAKGAETTGDLKRGMAALGRKDQGIPTEEEADVVAEEAEVAAVEEPDDPYPLDEMEQTLLDEEDADLEAAAVEVAVEEARREAPLVTAAAEVLGTASRVDEVSSRVRDRLDQRQSNNVAAVALEELRSELRGEEAIPGMAENEVPLYDEDGATIVGFHDPETGVNRMVEGSEVPQTPAVAGGQEDFVSMSPMDLATTPEIAGGSEVFRATPTTSTTPETTAGGLTTSDELGWLRDNLERRNEPVGTGEPVMEAAPEVAPELPPAVDPAALEAIDAKAEAYEDKLWDLEVDAEKPAVKRFAQRLVREGVIDQAELDGLAYMFKDRDMGAEDIASELRTSIQIWADNQKKGLTSGQAQGLLGGQGQGLGADRPVGGKDPAALVRARLGRSGDGGIRGYERASSPDDRANGRVATHQPSAAYAAEAEAAGYPAVPVQELRSTTKNVAQFTDAITAAKNASPYGAAVYVYPKADYLKMRLFLTPDGKSGFAIKKDGDIVSVFSDGGGKVHSLLELAVQEGGTKLDAFDTVLPKLYAVSGFKEVGRDSWNEEYAPDEWDKATFAPFNNGEPDIVYMVYDPAYSPFGEVVATPKKGRKKVKKQASPAPALAYTWTDLVDDSATLTGKNQTARHMVIGGSNAATETETETTPGQKADQGGTGFQTFVVGDIIYAFPRPAPGEETQLELYPGQDLGDITLPEFLIVDGVVRPTTNASGEPIAGTRKAVTNFWNWFGDSKAVDDQGRPRVFYHGSPRSFTTFREDKDTHFFTSDPAVAKTYKGFRSEGSVLSVYLKIDEVDHYDAEGRDWTRVVEEPVDEGEVEEARAAYYDAQLEYFEPSHGTEERTNEAGETEYIVTGPLEDEGAVFKTEEEAQEYMIELNDQETANYMNGLPYLDAEELANRGYLPSAGYNMSTDTIAENATDVYDAVWIDDVVDTSDGSHLPSTVIIVLQDNKRMKSATENEGTFDPEQADIRKKVANKPAHRTSRVYKDSVLREVRKTLREMGADGLVPVQVVDRIDELGSQGSYDPNDDFVRVMAMAYDVRGTTRHEVVHWAIENRVWTPEEYALLKKWAQSKPGLMAWAKENYPNESQADIIEEAVAEGFARWHGGKLGEESLSGAVVAIFQKLADFIQMLRRAFTQSGITRGEMKRAVELLAEFENGKRLAKWRKGRNTRPDFGRRQWHYTLSRELMAGNIDPAQHWFLSQQPSQKAQTAWHGSPKEDIDQFSLDFIGSGEGAQAFGWGLYFAEKKDVALWYKRKLTMGHKDPVDEIIQVDGKPIRQWTQDFLGTGNAYINTAQYEVADRIFSFLTTNKPYNGWIDALDARFYNEASEMIAAAEKEGNLQERDELVATARAVERVFEAVRNREITQKSYPEKGALYKVEVPEADELIDLDAPINKQSETVQKAAAKVKTHLAKIGMLDHYEGTAIALPVEEWKGLTLQNVIKVMAMDDVMPFKGEAGWSEELENAIDAGHPAMAASIYLRNLGIRGSRYLDRDSRPGLAGEPITRNFVIFDDSAIQLKAKLRVVRSSLANSPLSDPTNPNPGIFRRIHDQTMAFLGALAFKDVDASDNLVDAFKRKVTQRYQQIVKTQRRAEAILGVDRMAPGMNPMEMITADERGYKLGHLTDNAIRPMAIEMANRGVSMEDLGLYLYARHAPARNARIAKINPKFSKPDTPGSGMTDQEAADIMKEFADAGTLGDMQALATYIDAMIDMAQQERLRGGLISQVDISNGFQPGDFYVPLRGNESLEPELEMDFALAAKKGGGFSVSGQEGHRMFGRESRADLAEIVGYTITQAQEAIDRAYRNQISQNILQMLRAIGDKDFARIDRVKRVATLNRKTGKVEYQDQTRVTDPKEQQRTLYVKENGSVTKITFNDQNPSAMRFVKAAKNLGIETLPTVLRWTSLYTRLFTKSNTQWNVDFILANAVKDVQTGVLNASTLNQKGLRRAMIKNLLSMKPLMAAWWGATHPAGSGYGKGKKWDTYYAEFNENGGKINYNEVQPIEDALKTAQREIKNANRSGLSPVKAIIEVGSWIDRANSAFENMTRLAAYAALRDAGVPAKQAAVAVKELTTNFQQHGEWGPKVNAAYGFANASVIGSSRFIYTLSKKPQIIGGLVLVGMITDFINHMWDDEWDDYTEEEKDANFMILLPEAMGFDIKIPIGYGLNAIITAGRKMSELWRGKKNEDGTRMTLANAAGDFMWSSARAFLPISGSTWANFVVPTIGDPFVDIWQNQNNWGRPLRPEQSIRKEDQKPMSQLAFDSTGQFWVGLAEGLNAVGGGNAVIPGWGALDNAPSSYRHVFEQTVGGAGRSVTRTIELGASALAGEAVAPNDIPIARRFMARPYGAANADEAQVSAFYTRMNESRVLISQAESQIEIYGKDSPTYQSFRKDNEPVIEFAKTVKAAQSRLDKLNKAKNALERSQTHLEGLNKKDQKVILKTTGVLLKSGRKPTEEEVAKVKDRIETKRLSLATQFNEKWLEEVMKEGPQP